MVPQKHGEASKFIYNSGFYITTNVYPDFGEGLDGQAIKKRLNVFETKSLKHKDTSVTGKLRFFMINKYISEVDLVHLQHVKQTLCDNDYRLNVGNRETYLRCCREKKQREFPPQEN